MELITKKNITESKLRALYQRGFCGDSVSFLLATEKGIIVVKLTVIHNERYMLRSSWNSSYALIMLNTSGTRLNGTYVKLVALIKYGRYTILDRRR